MNDSGNGIWHTRPDPNKLTSWRGETLTHHLDIRFVEAGSDYLKASMPVDHRTLQPFGLLHGGASCALAESVASMAANLAIDTGNSHAVAMSINANHVRPARSGQVTATARPLHLGANTQVWSVDIHNNHEKLICVSRVTMAVIHRKWDAEKD